MDPIYEEPLGTYSNDDESLQIQLDTSWYFEDQQNKHQQNQRPLNDNFIQGYEKLFAKDFNTIDA